MSNRFKGHAILNTTYDIDYWGPLDSRFLVPTKADLYLEATWKPSPVHTFNAYSGMIVAVANDDHFEGVFCLTDADNFDDPSAWIELTSSSTDTPESGETSSFNIEIVDTLPTTGESNVIYFVRKSSTKLGDKFAEYIWVEDAFESIGSITDQVYTKQQTDTLILSAMEQLRNELGGGSGGESDNPAISQLQNNVAALQNTVTTHQTTLEVLSQNVNNISNDLENKVTRKYDTDGIEWSLLSPNDQKKLNALKFNGDDIEISASVSADNVQGLDSWISNNRDSVSGLVSSSLETSFNAIAALIGDDGKLPTKNISGLDTWISSNRNSVTGLFSEDNQIKLDSALTSSSYINIKMLEQDEDQVLILES